nr:hypothetical protein [Tanacetum cinerariifolium]
APSDISVGTYLMHVQRWQIVPRRSVLLARVIGKRLAGERP